MTLNHAPRELADGGQAAWSVEAVRRAERATGDAFTDGTLMQRAAHALAGRVRALHAHVPGSIVVLAGPGNNGGDALFAAAELARHDRQPVVVLVAGTAHAGGRSAVEGAGLRVLEVAHAGGQRAGDATEQDAGAGTNDGAAEQVVAAAGIVVDGILGIGARRERENPWDEIISAISPKAVVVAVDTPTPGVRADVTVTFGVAKTSLLLDPAAAGTLDVVDIGLPQDALGAPQARRLSSADLARMWPVPGPSDHKYTRGVVGIATGSDAYPGAAVLGCLAAVSAGTGMVRYVGPGRPSDAVLNAAPEVVHGPGRVQAWVVGSGIDGPSERECRSERYTSAFEALISRLPRVVDAGALSWLHDAQEPPRGADVVLTPHAGELVAVLDGYGVDTEREAVEADPVHWAQRAAMVTGCTVLLKGGVSVVAAPGEKTVFVENRAPAWLATAGTGDGLAGVVGVLLAAGLRGKDAAALAAYVHGRAAHLANPGGPVRAPGVAHHLEDAVRELLAGRR